MAIQDTTARVNSHTILSRRPKPIYDGWIYAAQEIGSPLVKVGACMARNPHARMKGLAYRYGTPMCLIGATHVTHWLYQIERGVHHLLHASWIEGEWFYFPMTPTLLRGLVEGAVEIVNAQILLYPGLPTSNLDKDYEMTEKDNNVYGSHQQRSTTYKQNRKSIKRQSITHQQRISNKLRRLKNFSVFY